MDPELIESRSPNFLVSVGDTDSAFELVRQAITVKPGFRTRIKVIQSQVVATPDLETIDLLGRKCQWVTFIAHFLFLLMLFDVRFPDENQNMTLMSNYSLNGCQFECAVSNSQKKCQCIPWDFPRTDKDYETTAICDLIGSYCFLEEMKNVGTFAFIKQNIK